MAYASRLYPRAKPQGFTLQMINIFFIHPSYSKPSFLIRFANSAQHLDESGMICA